VLAPKPLHDPLPRRVLLRKARRGLAEGPAQVSVAHLRRPGADPLARRCLVRTDQPAVGDEVAHGLEAVDVVDLVEWVEGEELADAGDGAQQVERLRRVLAGRAQDGELEVAEHLVVVANERQVRGDRFLDSGIGEGFGDAGAVLDPVELGGKRVLAAVVDEARQIALFPFAGRASFTLSRSTEKNPWALKSLSESHTMSATS